MKQVEKKKGSDGYTPVERLHNGGALKVKEVCQIKNISRSKFFKDQRAGLVETDGGVVVNPIARRYLGLQPLEI